MQVCRYEMVMLVSRACEQHMELAHPKSEKSSLLDKLDAGLVPRGAKNLCCVSM